MCSLTCISWPDGVDAPDNPDWERSAASFLLDFCPPDFRGYPALIRHPIVLAHIATELISSQLAVTRRCVASLRIKMTGLVTGNVLAETFNALKTEEERLIEAKHAVSLLESHLRAHFLGP